MLAHNTTPQPRPVERRTCGRDRPEGRTWGSGSGEKGSARVAPSREAALPTSCSPNAPSTAALCSGASAASAPVVSIPPDAQGAGDGAQL